MRFQPIATTSPANTTPIDRTSCATTSLAIVLATWVLNTRNATKLKNAAHATAYRGERTLVDTTVAIELAASWKPLVKSNASATAMTNTTPAVDRSTGRQIYAYLRTMDSTTSPMSSTVFSASSMASTMSFHLMTSIAS